jgi:hypothetical protein
MTFLNLYKLVKIQDIKACRHFAKHSSSFKKSNIHLISGINLSLYLLKMLPLKKVTFLPLFALLQQEKNGLISSSNMFYLLTLEQKKKLSAFFVLSYTK